MTDLYSKSLSNPYSKYFVREERAIDYALALVEGSHDVDVRKNDRGTTGVFVDEDVLFPDGRRIYSNLNVN